MITLFNEASKMPQDELGGIPSPLASERPASANVSNGKGILVGRLDLIFPPLA